jgi:hypothetical protein
MGDTGELREDLAAAFFVEEVGGDEAHLADAFRRAARHGDYFAIGVAREGTHRAASDETRCTGD